MKKRYWLRGGSVFFVIGLILSFYAASSINTNAIQYYAVGQSRPFNVGDYLYLIPGINFLPNFAYGGTGGLIVGAIIFSTFYGLVGVLIGGLYGKIKNRNNVI